jgi:hypothetical protein
MRLLDLQELTALCGFEKVGDFQKAHRDWVDEAIKREMVGRESGRKRSPSAV